MFNITLKYFSICNNKRPVSRVAHIKGFSFMFIPVCIIVSRLDLTDEAKNYFHRTQLTSGYFSYRDANKERKKRKSKERK